MFTRNYRTPWKMTIFTGHRRRYSRARSSRSASLATSPIRARCSPSHWCAAVMISCGRPTGTHRPFRTPLISGSLPHRVPLGFAWASTSTCPFVAKMVLPVLGRHRPAHLFSCTAGATPSRHGSVEVHETRSDVPPTPTRAADRLDIGGSAPWACLVRHGALMQVYGKPHTLRRPFMRLITTSLFARPCPHRLAVHAQTRSDKPCSTVSTRAMTRPPPLARQSRDWAEGRLQKRNSSGLLQSKTERGRFHVGRPGGLASRRLSSPLCSGSGLIGRSCRIRRSCPAFNQDASASAPDGGKHAAMPADNKPVRIGARSAPRSRSVTGCHQTGTARTRIRLYGYTPFRRRLAGGKGLHGARRACR